MCASARCSASLTKGPAGGGQSGTAAAIWKNGSSNPLRVGSVSCAALAAAGTSNASTAGRRRMARGGTEARAVAAQGASSASPRRDEAANTQLSATPKDRFSRRCTSGLSSNTAPRTVS